MQVMTKTNLGTLRQELKEVPGKNLKKVAQEDLAREAGLRVTTYRNVEQGRATTYKKANAILEALNRLRKDRGLEPVTLDDLGINIA